MPTRSMVVRVRHQQRTYELTAAKVRALTDAARDPAGKVSDAVAFATARSLTSAGLLRKQGADWYISEKGRAVGREARRKLNSQ